MQFEKKNPFGIIILGTSQQWDKFFVTEDKDSILQMVLLWSIFTLSKTFFKDGDQPKVLTFQAVQANFLFDNTIFLNGMNTFPDIKVSLADTNSFISCFSLKWNDVFLLASMRIIQV